MHRHFLTALILTAALFCASEPHAERTALDFELLEQVSPLGGASNVAAAPEAGVLLLQFWASWCHSCGALMWDMDEILSRHGQVQYLAVSLDEDAEAADRYVRRHALFKKYAGRYFLDAGKVLSASLGVETVPSILLVSPDGDVLVHKSGHLNSSDLRELVSAIE